jgi:leucyl-tRNA synthetase
VVETQIEKMSKSKLNVVNPDEVIDQYGADAMRLYELFMGPLEATKPWQMDGVEGVYRFLGKVWRLVVDEVSGNKNERLQEVPAEAAPELLKTLHKTIKKLTEDIESMRFNTAISQMMIFVNEAGKAAQIPVELLKTFLKVLAPFAPHLSEELWNQLGEKELICKKAWPEWDAALIAEETIPIVIQVNGKKRGKLEMPVNADGQTIESAALESDEVKKFLEGKKPKKVIVVPGRLINIVV